MRLLPFAALVLLAACAAARPAPDAAAVVVADFALPAGAAGGDAPTPASGPVARVRHRLHEGEHASPAQLADRFADSLVDGLGKAGIAARRLAPGEAPPAQGWLVSGRFTALDGGDRLRRSAVGLGDGATAVAVEAALCDLAHPGRPADPLAGADSSGRAPGSAAATAITRTPWGAAARFVRSGKDLERDVADVAGELAAAVAQRLQHQP